MISRTVVNKTNFRTAISDTDISHTKKVITLRVWYFDVNFNNFPSLKLNLGLLFYYNYGDHAEKAQKEYKTPKSSKTVLNFLFYTHQKSQKV